ncbi:uncharacterized protein Dwil_GK15371 [Drosophila willistoni]|uniref:Uncharacterized protein n=1 Tax=Drosophila willistoni TaxID=7260 RepID=B4MUS6_DROWI|nr:uncharacterized protein Dwil_GK15371 [Drosophila willistoni]
MQEIRLIIIEVKNFLPMTEKIIVRLGKVVPGGTRTARTAISLDSIMEANLTVNWVTQE